jgi:hypothetical protein
MSVALDARDTKLEIGPELTKKNLRLSHPPSSACDSVRELIIPAEAGYAGPVGFEPTTFGCRREERRSPMSYPGCPRPVYQQL